VNIELQGLQARHPSAAANAPPALQGISLQLSAGEQVAIIGPSGAGKTSLLQVLSCAQQPTGGELLLGGQSPWRLSSRELRLLRGRLFLAPQVPPLPPRQRVVTSVLAGRLPAMSLAASLRSLFYPADIPAAYEALSHFDLSDKLFDRVDRLSGGERQRVGLARALLSPASLWLIDEPLSALDPMRARIAMTALVRLARERQITMVATLHQVDMALTHFDRIIGLLKGQMVFDLPSAEVTRERLANLYEQQEQDDEQAQEFGRDALLAESDQNSLVPAPVVMHCR
jgi:phosphonate transport system ATP-binding protein